MRDLLGDEILVATQKYRSDNVEDLLDYIFDKTYAHVRLEYWAGVGYYVDWKEGYPDSLTVKGTSMQVALRTLIVELYKTREIN